VSTNKPGKREGKKDETREDVMNLIRNAINFHFAGMREDGERMPEPDSEAEYVEILTA